MTGVLPLLRFQFQRDRIRLPMWTFVIALLVIAVASSWDRLYPTAQERQELAAILSNNPPVTSLLGPLYNPLSSGGLTAWRMGVAAVLVLGILHIFTVTRHLRAEEESGRAEIMLSTPLARSSPVLAALLLTLGSTAVYVVVTTIGLTALGFGVGGSLLLGLSGGLCAWVFAGIAAVLNQVARTARGCHAAAGLVVGALWVVAIAGNLTSTWLVWLSPFGWANQTQAFAAGQWWVLALPTAAALAFWAAAAALAWERDLGAGLLPDRVGPARGSARLAGPAGLAWRLDGLSVLVWALAFLLLGAAIGLSRNALIDFSTSSPALGELIRKMGGAALLIDAFVAVYLSLGALAVGYFVISLVMRIHREESLGHAGLLLSTATSRMSWAGAHLAVAVIGAIVSMVVLGLAIGAGLGMVAGEGLGDVLRFSATALGMVPATLLVAGLTMLIVGFWPRLTMLPWILMTVFAVLTQFGSLLGLPEWLQQLSPFSHLPRLPGQAIEWTPIIVMLAGAIVLAVGGLVGLRRRDIAR